MKCGVVRQNYRDSRLAMFEVWSGDGETTETAGWECLKCGVVRQNYRDSRLGIFEVWSGEAKLQKQ